MTRYHVRRYRVVFTPVGWQVVDTQDTRDPVAAFGIGSEEYQRAREVASRLNQADRQRVVTP